MTDSIKRNSALVADIGGTNARFGVVVRQQDGTYAVEDNQQYLCREFADFPSALDHYLADRTTPSVLAISLAGPVRKQRAVMTNLDWHFDADQLRDRFGLESVQLIHDLAAQALYVTRLCANDFEVLRPGDVDPQAPKAVIGLGTGLGIAQLNCIDGQWRATSGEGGHASFGPQTDLERKVYDALLARDNYVSLESLLSGPGLVNIYQTLSAENGDEIAFGAPKDILRAARMGVDRVCVQAVGVFVSALGNVVGNTALTLGAGGGVYLAGGLTKHLLPFLSQGELDREFSASGFRQRYLDPVPIYAIKHPHAGLVGAASLYL